MKRVIIMHDNIKGHLPSSGTKKKKKVRRYYFIVEPFSSPILIPIPNPVYLPIAAVGRKSTESFETSDKIKRKTSATTQHRNFI